MSKISLVQLKVRLKPVDYSEKTTDEAINQDVEEEYTKDDVGELTSDESDDVFKPVQPISQELLSKMVDEKPD